MTTFTLWTNRYATEAQVKTATWKEWVADFTQHRAFENGKGSLPCVVLGRMVDGGRRTNNNVLTVEGLALDVECLDGDQVAYQARVQNALTQLADLDYVAYTTWSHTEAEPRIRIILPLTAAAQPEEYKGAMSYLNALTGNIGDPGAQKISQPVFLPYHDPAQAGIHWAVHHEGRTLDLSNPLVKEVTELRSALGEGIGRAPYDNLLRQSCKKVLSGKPFAESGNRDETATRIAWHLARAGQAFGIQAVEMVFEQALDAMGTGAPTAEDIQAKIARGVEKLAGEVTRKPEGPMADVGALQQELGSLTGQYVIQHNRTFYFLTADGGYSRPYTKDEARIGAVKHLSAFPDVRLNEVTSRGVHRKRAEDLAEEYGDAASDVVIDLAAGRSRFERGTMFEATVSWPTDLRPRHHPPVERWLKLLGGDKLLDWLSILHDLKRLLSTLVMMGPPQSGKTLLAMGCAARFGSDAPSSQNSLTGKFQEELARCPLVYIDEEITDSQYDRNFLAAIRSELSIKERSVNRKYLSHMQMRGAIRCIISSNHLPFKAKDSSTGSDLKAIAERFHWITATPEAVEYLASVPPETKQLWRERQIAEHIMHLEETRTISTEHRFGVPGDNQKLADLINIGVRWNSWVTEWVCNAVLDGFRKMRSGDSEIRGGAFAHEGAVYVRVRTIVKAWELYLPNNRTAPDTRPVSDALKGISDGKFRPSEIGIEGNNQQRYYRIRKSPCVAWLEETGAGTGEEYEHALHAEVTREDNVVKLG